MHNPRAMAKSLELRGEQRKETEADPGPTLVHLSSSSGATTWAVFLQSGDKEFQTQLRSFLSTEVVVK